MKIFKISYYLDSADGYIIDEKNNVVSCDGDTHINFIISHYVIANDKNKKVYASKETEEPKIYTERLNDRTKYNLIINGEKVGHLTVQENLSDHYYVLTALKIYKDELKRLGHGTALMNMMLSDSKYLDKPIIVSPYPYDENEIEVEDLRSFYAKFGFVPSEESQYSMILER
jgi:hypothetical protein